ncbi:MAG: SpoIIE family protein phosphatase [Gemmatimonadaceae bacterium]|nr:SpoIIE family protein phosphatase [Gemmatimonadaceae bacterium]
MKELESVLTVFRESTKCEVTVWEGDSATASALRSVASTAARPLVPDDLPTPDSDVGIVTNGGILRVALIEYGENVYLSVGPCLTGETPEELYLSLLKPLIVQAYRTKLEVEHTAQELSDRFEEISLLYTIGEILGRTVSLKDAAETILNEIAEIVGSTTGAILVHDEASNSLSVVAATGVGTENLPAIWIEDPNSVSARVFRTEHEVLSEAHEPVGFVEQQYRRGVMLSVPIMWTTPEGGEPLGVINLSGRTSRTPYTAGDQKLVRAIATQIGTAIQNARLVKASVEQDRLLQEMHLAHDLQMKLLPNPSVASPLAHVTARVVPADSVGGDFYHLFKIQKDSTGVMIGDVSGHGYRAALIMALVMSAAAIHAQNSDGPSEMLSALLDSLREELRTTEMHVSVFYAIIDHKTHGIRYANAGHPHAFVYGATEKFERLRAIDPPLGMVESAPTELAYPWRAGHDIMVLFTDGISDARNAADERLGEEIVLETILLHKHLTVEEISMHVFDLLDEHMGDIPPRDDLTLVLIKT